MSTTDATVKCPKCGTLIPITEALAGPLLEATRSEMQTRIDVAILQATEATQKAAAKAASIEEEIISRMKVQRAQADMLAKQEAREQIDAAQQEAEALRTKLAVAQQAQAEALRKERELFDRERELELTIERRISDETVTIRAAAQNSAEDAWKLKLIEKDTLLESMSKKIEELKQKAEQGSQQMQGEAQELELETVLRTVFPFDVIGEVGKGVTGADITQEVHALSGAVCGSILYESKRTKNWSPSWLSKFREDGRKAHADILVLVSTALPEEVVTFGNIDNVWVCAPAVALPLATVLRASLLSVHATKQAQDGMKTKSEEVYAYVTGPQFRHRVEALAEAFTTMQEDLVAEQKAVARQWAKRSTQIERVLTSTSGMFGDLQGIAGKALPEPEGLALPGGGE